MSVARTPCRISSDLSSRMANMGVLCALLVVLIHCYVPSETWSGFWWFTEIVGGGEWLHGCFIRCAVPYFFLAAGFFLAGHVADGQGWWRRAVLKRCRTLVVPYLVWSTVAAVLVGTLMVVWKGESLTVGWFLRAFGVNPFSLPLLKQLWFLQSLFLLVFLSPILVRALSPMSLVVTAGLYLIYVLRPFEWPWQVYALFGLSCSLEGLLYFSLGMWLRLHPMKMPRRGTLLAIALPIFLAIAFAYAYCDGLGRSVAANLLKTVSVPCAMGVVWALTPACRWPRWLTQNAFPIFLLHLFPLIAIRRAAGPGWGAPPTGNLFLVLSGCWLVAVVFALIATEGLRRLFPRVADFVFGGR